MKPKGPAVAVRRPQILLNFLVTCHRCVLAKPTAPLTFIQHQRREIVVRVLSARLRQEPTTQRSPHAVPEGTKANKETRLRPLSYGQLADSIMRVKNKRGSRTLGDGFPEGMRIVQVIKQAAAEYNVKLAILLNVANVILNKFQVWQLNVCRDHLAVLEVHLTDHQFLMPGIRAARTQPYSRPRDNEVDDTNSCSIGLSPNRVHSSENSLALLFLAKCRPLVHRPLPVV